MTRQSLTRADRLSRKRFPDVSSSHSDMIKHIVIEFVGLSFQGFRSVRMLGDGRIIAHGNR